MVVMRVIVSTLAACALCAPAHALDVPVFAGGSSIQGPVPVVEGPVIAGDGAIVLALESTFRHVNVVAFSPGLDSPRTLASFGHPPKGWEGRHVTLAGTPRGVVINDDVSSAGPHCCLISFLRA